MKKTLSLLLAAAVAASLAIPAFAETIGSVAIDGDISVYDEDGESVSVSTLTSSDGSISLDGINPDQTIYIPLSSGATDVGSSGVAYADDLMDSDLFKLSLDKSGDGKSLVKSITQIESKSLGGDTTGRAAYLKVVLGASTTTSDLKATITATFKAKKTVDPGDANSSTGTWTSGDKAQVKLIFWINNTKIDGSDGDTDTGDSVYFSPTSNEDNTLIWGDDRAALEFEADDDADDFYAKLSTKSNSEIYTEYGDPIGADLWFYDFVGNPTISSTSRATLTLGIPWDEDDEAISTSPEDCFIYLLSADGTLSDVTNQFTYSEDIQEIEGWTIKTRALGTYVVSDSELILSDYEEEASDEESTDAVALESVTADSTDKVIPNTGSGDAVNLAVVGAVVSLAAAGAVAFRKGSR